MLLIIQLFLLFTEIFLASANNLNLGLCNCSVHAISLVCSEQALQSRLKKDMDAGMREKG
jgi:hypothetical protein